MPDTEPILSGDSHVVEPADLWQAQIAPAYLGRAPRLERTAEGDFWRVEGTEPLPAGLLGAAGEPPERLDPARRVEEGPPGAWDARARVAEVDRDGISGEVIYPTVALRLYQLEDLAFQDACIRAYNAWLADFCAAVPGRYKGLGLATLQDLERGRQQMRDARKLGLAGLMVAITPGEDRPYSDPSYDPFWATAAELGLPLSLHVHTGRRMMSEWTMLSRTLVAHEVQRTIAELVWGGVFERHPDLQIVSAENDAVWAAHLLQRMDYLYRRRRVLQGFAFGSDVLPSEFCRRQVFYTFMDDRGAVLAREIIGTANLLWASDYPHTDSSYPHSRELIEQICAGVPAADRRRLIHENTAALYGFGA
jgi:predicted TIM-barrel fold metal-dependent hydrolase